MTRRYLPHPILSLGVWALWLFLVNSIAISHILFGALLAWLIPYMTQSFWPEPIRVARPGQALRFVMLVLYDILIANVQVALLIVGPRKRLKPAFLVIPLDVRKDFTITTLANTISLTPGTVSADLSADKRQLLVHSLTVDDIDEAIAHIKQRYEAPLKEIFE